MKIATWNIDRLKIKKKLNYVVENIKKIDADIIILTEFNNLVQLPFYKYKFETEKLPKEPYNYAETERRVAIFSKFPIKRTFKTYDDLTTCCAEIETNFGNLIIYGTIVGIIGFSDKNFKSDLEKQIEDIKNIAKLGNFCYVGDLNTSFSDKYYFTHFACENFLKCFLENDLENITENLQNNIDHFVVSKNFLKNLNFEISEWNQDLLLSDHKGICVELNAE